MLVMKGELHAVVTWDNHSSTPALQINTCLQPHVFHPNTQGITFSIKQRRIKVSYKCMYSEAAHVRLRQLVQMAQGDKISNALRSQKRWKPWCSP